MVSEIGGTTDDLTRLAHERATAVRRARELEHEVGRLRGQVARLESLSVWRRTWRRYGRAAAHRVGRVLERGR